MDKHDIIELARGYIGAGLITWDGCTGWRVVNAIRYIMEGGYLFK